MHTVSLTRRRALCSREFYCIPEVLELAHRVRIICMSSLGFKRHSQFRVEEQGSFMLETFKHELFLRGRPDLLPEIRRRIPPSRQRTGSNTRKNETLSTEGMVVIDQGQIPVMEVDVGRIQPSPSSDSTQELPNIMQKLSRLEHHVAMLLSRDTMMTDVLARQAQAVNALTQAIVRLDATFRPSYMSPEVAMPHLFPQPQPSLAQFSQGHVSSLPSMYVTHTHPPQQNMSAHSAHFGTFEDPNDLNMSGRLTTRDNETQLLPILDHDLDLANAFM
jgi:hypothetical protein